MRKLVAATLAMAAICPFVQASAQGFGRGDPVPATLPIGNRPGSPLYDMPPGQRLVSAFGERPVFSPDGKKLAFMGKSYGDAFEYDLATGAIRNLTAHFPHKGFLRVQYLSDGSYLLLGPRFPAATREQTRYSRIELFWMDAAASRAPLPLGKTVFEGIATSRAGSMIGWTEIALDPARPGAASTTLYTARVAVEGDRARLADVRRSVTTRECLIEAQDFLPGNHALTLPCYKFGANESAATEVLSVDLASGALTRYPTPSTLYGEVEGLFPDGRRTLVECAGDRRTGRPRSRCGGCEA